MRSFLLLIILLIWLPAGRGAEVAIAATATQSQELLAAARQNPRVFVGDLSKGDKGNVYEGALTAPAGRYRLHALLAAAPTGGLGVGAVQVHLQVGGTERIWPLQLLAADDAFIPVTLTVDHGGGKLPVKLSWSVYESKLHKQLKDQRALAVAKATGGGPQLGGAGKVDDLFGAAGGGGGLDFDLGENELQTLAEARKTKVRVMAAGVHLERLSPLAITVHTSKVVYRPGEPGTATITIVNHGAEAVDAPLRLALVSGLEQVATLPEQALVLAAGARTSLEVSFTTEGLRWGAELRASAGEATGRGIFAVTDNFWDVHQYTFEGSLAAYADPERARQAVKRWRDQGYTAIEALFWAPDDMFDFTPETERFFGAQGAYPGRISGTRNIIEALHENGMSMTFYANWWGGGGPPTFEMMRKHPEWFANANYQGWVLDDWELLCFWADCEHGKVRAPGVEWCHAPMALPPFDGAFEAHAREIIGSVEQFGWDAIRYDSAYSRAWNVRAMQLVRSMVEAKYPDFRFGMNSFAMNDARALALPNFRGGVVMGEGLRIERVKHLAKWLDSLMQWRDVCWPYDVQVMPLYQHGDEQEPSPLDQVLAVATHYAGGAHFGAHPPATAYGSASSFALRHAEYLWDTRQRRPRDPGELVRLPGKPALLKPERMTHLVDLGEGRQRLLVHLLNVPAAYTLYQGFAEAAPAPLVNQRVELGLPAGARIERAVQLSPFIDGWQQPLVIDGTAVTLPELRFWSLLVIELAGGEPIPTVVTVADEQMSYLREWRVHGPYPIAEEKELPGWDALAPLAFPLEVGDWPSWRQEELPVSLAQALEQPGRNWVSGYAWVNIRSEQEREATLLAKADNAIAAWLNGEPVLAATMGEFQGLGEIKATVRLRQGDNPLLVKITNQWLAWDFVVRLAEADGQPLTDGVTYTTEVPK